MRGKAAIASMLGAAFATAAIGTAVINAATGGDEQTVSPAESVNATVAKHYGVLRKDAQGDDSKFAALSQKQMADTGINPKLARTGSTLGDDVSIVTPSSKGLCVGTAKLGVLTCGDTEAAVSGTVIGSIICGRIPTDKVEVLGAFPDEVTELSAELSDKSTTTYPVKNNTFVQQFDKSEPVPLYVSFTANGEKQRVRTGLPTDGNLSCTA